MFAALLLAQLAQAGEIAVIRNASDELWMFDTLTEQFSLVGPLGIQFNFGGLAWDSNAQVMYLFDYAAPYNMYTVNLNTGRATLVGSTGLQMISAAYDPNNDVLWAGDISNTGWYSIDRATGRATARYNFGIIPSGAGWSPVERAIVYNRIGAADFYAFDPDSGTNTQLGGPNTFINDAGMSYDADTQLYWVFDYSGNVFKVDPARGYQMQTAASALPSIDASETISRGVTMGLRVTAGACPGLVTFEVRDATPNRQVAFAGGGSGNSTIRGGQCAGTRLPIRNPRLLGTAQANGAGVATFQANVPGAACQREIVAVDLSSCSISNTTNP